MPSQSNHRRPILFQTHSQVEEAWRRQQELLLDLIRLTQTDLDKPARQKALSAAGQSEGRTQQINNII